MIIFYKKEHNESVTYFVRDRAYLLVFRTEPIRVTFMVRLKERRTIHSLSLLFRIMHTSTPNYLLSRFQFLTTLRNRHQALLSIPHHRTSLYSSSYTVEIPRLWNSLPNDVRDCRILSQFKIKLENFVLVNVFSVVSVKNYVVSVKCVVSVKKYVVSVKCAVARVGQRGAFFKAELFLRGSALTSDFSMCLKVFSSTHPCGFQGEMDDAADDKCFSVVVQSANKKRMRPILAMRARFPDGD
ncbi:hypothetical protein ANN_23875 [Periplaneta americana]|uniref:Uncharacterized protein n=1 Tax=Periplaneta americana TaxID=6978 RepID=A0ABQ8S1S5_PERAM|nr:hypothetical protein ANN_23875 [Periplaneta americana]